MFTDMSVSSQRVDEHSKGKKQRSVGKNPEISMGYMKETGEPLLRIEVNDHETGGSGARGGWTRGFSKTGIVYFDKETVIAAVQHAFQNNLISPEEIFSSLDLLEAATRAERKRRRPK